MGMKSTGLGIAEFAPVVTLAAADTVIVNQFTTFTGTNNYWVPRESTLQEIAAFTLGGSNVLAVGQATLVAGTVTVALTTVTASSKVFVTVNDLTPNAIGVSVSAGVGFTITSASGADTSVVNYFVLS